jgi:thiol-disulfide isomerase/thioredoxin
LAGQGGATLAGTAPYISWADLGQPLGTRATLVQFSSAFCAPCRATRQILAEVAGMTTGVAHVEIDAESHLNLSAGLMCAARRPSRTWPGRPDRAPRDGQPRKADVIAALGEVTGHGLSGHQVGNTGNCREPGADQAARDRFLPYRDSAVSARPLVATVSAGRSGKLRADRSGNSRGERARVGITNRGFRDSGQHR